MHNKRIMQLDIRAQTLLKALVERYIADGQPVGSRALSKISGLDLSPATIRNIMADHSDDMVIAGERNLLSVSDLSSNMSSLRQMFEMFEQKTGLMQLLDVSSKATGVQIFIGGESKLVPMDEMSVVTAPYEVNGKVVGTLGVIGPTRMAYERVIPIVDITAKLLSNALSHP